MALAELRGRLEAEGVAGDEIEARVGAERARARAAAAAAAATTTTLALAGGGADAAGPGRETHAAAARKAEEMAGLRSAFGLPPAPVEGEAFDRELKEKQKQCGGTKGRALLN